MNERAAHISETPLKPLGKNFTFFFFFKINDKQWKPVPQIKHSFLINIFFFDFFTEEWHKKYRVRSVQEHMHRRGRHKAYREWTAQDKKKKIQTKKWFIVNL